MRRAWAAWAFLCVGILNDAEPAWTAEPDPVNVGTTNVLADVGNFIADKRGYFAAEHLKVNLIAFNAAARMIAPLASGDLDVGSGGVAAGLFNAANRGVGLKIVSDKSTSVPGFGDSGLVVRKDIVDAGRYGTPKDLKGFKLAIPAEGTATSASLDRFFGAAGFSLNDMDVVYLSFPQMVNALENKAVDVAFLTEPSLTNALEQGAVRITSDAEIIPNHQIAVTLNSEKFVSTRREVAVRYLRALLRGVRDYTDVTRDGRLKGRGAEDVIQILTEYSLIKDPDVYRRISAIHCDTDGRINLASLEGDLAYFRSHGFIQGNVTVADVVDTSIAADAVRVLGPYTPKK